MLGMPPPPQQQSFILNKASRLKLIAHIQKQNQAKRGTFVNSPSSIEAYNTTRQSVNASRNGIHAQKSVGVSMLRQSNNNSLNKSIASRVKLPIPLTTTRNNGGTGSFFNYKTTIRQRRLIDTSTRDSLNASTLSQAAVQQQLADNEEETPAHPHMIEHVQKDGRVYVLACGPLLKPRYINPMLEKELVEFKEEVESKFSKSEMQRYEFPKRVVIYRRDAGDDASAYGVSPQAAKRHLIQEESRSPDKSEKPNELLREFLQSKNISQTKTLRRFHNKNAAQVCTSLASIPEIKQAAKFKLSELLSKQSSKPSTSLQTPKEHSGVRKIVRSRVNESRFKDYNASPQQMIFDTTVTSERYCSTKPIKNTTMRTSRNIIPSRNGDNSCQQKNYISVNNPRVVVQSPQTNTIILFDSQLRDAGVSGIWSSLEHSGVLAPQNMQRVSNIRGGISHRVNNILRHEQRKVFDQYTSGIDQVIHPIKQSRNIQQRRVDYKTQVGDYSRGAVSINKSKEYISNNQSLISHRQMPPSVRLLNQLQHPRLY